MATGHSVQQTLLASLKEARAKAALASPQAGPPAWGQSDFDAFRTWMSIEGNIGTGLLPTEAPLLKQAAQEAPPAERGQNDDEPNAEVSCRPDALVLYNPVLDNGPGGWGHERVKDIWESFSPLHNVRGPAPPTLFLLGTADALIPVATGEAFAEAVRAAGGRCDLHLAEGGAHGWFNRGRGGYVETTEQLVAFLASLGWVD